MSTHNETCATCRHWAADPGEKPARRRPVWGECSHPHLTALCGHKLRRRSDEHWARCHVGARGEG